MISQSHSLFDGVVLGKDTYLFIGVEDARAEVPNSHGIIWKLKDGQWNSVEINETLVSCTLTKQKAYHFVAIAETGKELDVGETGVNQNVIASGIDSPASNGPLTNVNCIKSGEIYAVGTARQVYRKLEINRWIRLDQSCKPQKPADRANVAFLGIDGFSAEDLYAVGWGGEIWHFDGKGWSQVESPTNLSLLAVHCCSSGDVYACGQQGIILRGRDSRWRVVKQSETQEVFRDIVEFRGKIYLCSNNLLYLIQDDDLSLVTADFQVRSFGKLKSTDQVLLSIGLKDAAVFDGATWERLLK
jgi:hypothetical protein